MLQGYAAGLEVRLLTRSDFSEFIEIVTALLIINLAGFSLISFGQGIKLYLLDNDD